MEGLVRVAARQMCMLSQRCFYCGLDGAMFLIPTEAPQRYRNPSGLAAFHLPCACEMIERDEAPWVTQLWLASCRRVIPASL